jgi:hypothetical protein
MNAFPWTESLPAEGPLNSTPVPHESPPSEDPPEVANLKAQFRASMPQLAKELDELAAIRHLVETAQRLASSGMPVKTVVLKT